MTERRYLVIGVFADDHRRFVKWYAAENPEAAAGAAVAENPGLIVAAVINTEGQIFQLSTRFPVHGTTWDGERSTGVSNDAGYYSRIMERVAASTGRRARVVDAQGRLLDLAG
jgi:hypothetical protein